MSHRCLRLLASAALTLSLAIVPGTRPGSSASSTAADQHTVFVLARPISLAQVADLIRPTGSNVIAFDHTGRTRGGYLSPNGLPLDTAVKDYRAGVADQASLAHVFAFRITGAIDTSALAASVVPIAAAATIPSGATVAVSLPGVAARPIDIVRIGQRGRTQAVGGRPRGLAVLGATDWAPAFGKLHAFNLPTECLFVFGGVCFFGTDKGRMYHELTWTSQADIDEFGDDTYEHDFKLFSSDTGGIAGVACFGGDHFWVQRSQSLRWESTLPDSTKPYFDSDFLDQCNWKDFTVGMHWPKFLAPNVTYTVTVTADRGTQPSTPLQLAGERLRKFANCDVDPNCVAITPGSHVGTSFFIAQNEGISAPTCRLWTRTLGELSTPC